MKKIYLKNNVELIESALSDKVSFNAIRSEFGLREVEVKNIMRKP